MYASVIRPVLEYACPVWDTSLPNYLSDVIEMIQQRVLRSIYPGLHYDDILVLVSLQSLKTKRDSICKAYFNRLKCNTHLLLNLRSPRDCGSCRRAVVPSCRRAVVPSCRRAVVPSCRRAVVPSCRRAVVPSCRRAVVPSCRRAVVPSCRRAVVPSCRRAVVPSCRRAVVPSCRRAVVPSCRRAVVPSCRRAVVPSWPSCRRAVVPSCRRAVVPSCRSRLWYFLSPLDCPSVREAHYAQASTAVRRTEAPCAQASTVVRVSARSALRAGYWATCMTDGHMVVNDHAGSAGN